MGKRAHRVSASCLAIAAAFAGGPGIAQVAVVGTAAVRQEDNVRVVTTTNGSGGYSSINWQSFSVPTGTVTRFDQPSATSLSINRVVGGTQSLIDGTLSSNGKLVLVNPAGIAFGVGSVVDTAGFTASTLSMSDQDALTGVLRFANAGNAQGLTAQGRIVAREGDVFLIAPAVQVREGAVIQAAKGATVLAAGQAVQITGRGLEGIVMEVQAPGDTAVNLGKLEAGAVGMFAGTLRHSGEIRAVAATHEGGRVVLKAAGDATVEGTVIATQSARGGQIDVFGTQVAVQGEAVLDASGEQGGGSIRVGGDYQGGNAEVPNATRTFIGSQARIAADALDDGDGGRIIVWSDGSTRSYGHISVRGGEQGGNGGFVEVSGKQALDMTSQVDASAPHGMRGTLLIDPQNLYIASANSSIELDVASTLNDLPTDSYLAPATLNAATADVILRATKLIAFQEAVHITQEGVGLTAEAPAISVGASISTNNGPILLRGTGAPDPNHYVQLVQATVTAGTSTFTATSPSDISLDRSAINAAGGILVESTEGKLEVRASILNALPATSGGTAGDIALKSNGAGDLRFVTSHAWTDGRTITLRGHNTGTNGDVGLGGVIIQSGTLDAGTGSIVIHGTTASPGGPGVGFFAVTDGISLSAKATGPGGLTVVGKSAGTTGEGPGVDIHIVNPIVRYDSSSLNLTLSGATFFDQDAGINVGDGGRVGFRPSTDTPISVGGTAVANTFWVSQDMLDKVTAGTVAVGDTQFKAGIHIHGPVSLAPGKALSLLQGPDGVVVQDSGAPLRVDNLHVAAGTVQLTAANEVDMLSGTASSSFEFWNNRSLVVGTVDGVSGITSGTSPDRSDVTLTFTPGATLSQNAPILAATLHLQQADSVGLGNASNQFSRVLLGSGIGSADITNASTEGSFLEMVGGPVSGNLAYRAQGDVTLGSLSASAITVSSVQGGVNSTGTLTSPVIDVTARQDISLDHAASGGSATIQALSSLEGDIQFTSNSNLLLQSGASAPTGQIAIATSGLLEVQGNVALTAERTILNANVTLGPGAQLSFVSPEGSATNNLATLASLTMKGATLRGTGDIEITGGLNVPETLPNEPPESSIHGTVGGQLTLRGTSTLSRTTWITGYRLNQAGTLSVDAALALVGHLENTGTITVSAGATPNELTVDTLRNASGAQVSVEGHLQIQESMVNDGTVTVSGPNGSLQLVGSPNPAVTDAVLTNNGQITLTGARGINPTDSQGGIVNNWGTVRRTGNADTSLIDVERFNNFGTLQVDQGKLLIRYDIDNPGFWGILPVFPVNVGDVVLAAGATLATDGNNLRNEGRISGTGTLDLGTGTLTNAGTLSPGGDGVIGSQPLTIHAASVHNTDTALLKFDISGDQFDQLAITGGEASYTADTRLAVNLLSIRDIPATYTLQTGGSTGQLPKGLSGVSPGSSLRFGSLILDLAPGGPVLFSAPPPIPAGPPAATPLPLIPPDVDGPDNPLAPLAAASTDNDGGGTETLVVDNGLVCLP